jgi:hypothetical protein
MKIHRSSKLAFTSIQEWSLYLITIVLLFSPIRSSAQLGAGYALQFDGVNDKVDVGVGKFANVTNSFTMELWVNPTKGRTNTPQSITGFDGLTNQSYAIFPELGSAAYGDTTHGGVGISVGTNGVSVVEHTAGTIPTPLVYATAISTWTHIALVYSNKQPSLYINGTFAATGFSSLRTYIHPSASLGDAGPTGTYGPYKGQIDEVRIWNGVRTAAQIQTNRFLRLTGTESNLVAYFRLDEGTGTTTVDTMTNNRTGTLTNGVLWVASTAPIGGRPIVTTLSPITNENSANIKGDINPNNFPTSGWFEWGFTTNYGNITAPYFVGLGTSTSGLGDILTGLSATNFYHYRIVASNVCGTSFGLDQSFFLGGPPAATTLPATLVKPISARLNAAVALSGVPGSVWFNWGVSTNFANSSPWNPRRGLSFDGLTNYVSTGSNIYNDVSNNFTMELMVLPTAARSTTEQANFGITGIGGQRYAIFPAAGVEGESGVGISVGTNGITVFEHAPGLLASPLVYEGTVSGWNHVAVVYKNRQPLLYLNGTLVAVGLTSSMGTVRPSANFGESGLGYGYYAGSLDEVRLWSTSLSQANVRQWMGEETVTNHPAISNLIGHWTMNEGAGGVTADTSVRVNNGLLKNFTPWFIDNTNAFANLTNLAPATTYYYRVVASNSLGVATGSTLNFFTAGEPDVNTDSPASVSFYSATLRGSVNPNGFPATWGFQWGRTLNYGNTTSLTSAGSGTNFLNQSVTLSNVLTYGTTYHYRIFATNTFGTTYGPDVIFQTSAPFSLVSNSFPALRLEEIKWGDYDNDGLLDVFLVNREYSTPLTQLWRNLGGGTFTNINAGFPPLVEGGGEWGDYDNDGFLDLLMFGYRGTNVVTELWHNGGNGTFTKINVGLPGVANAEVAWGDYDNDGRLDILLAGRDAVLSQQNGIWRNNGNGTFTKITLPLIGAGVCSAAWGDYDNDARLDFAIGGVGASYFPGDGIWHNTGKGTFVNINAAVTALQGLSGMAWGDYNNDGNLDLVSAGSSFDSGLVASIWRNRGDGTFTNVQVIPEMYGASWGDFDNDGLLDLATVNEFGGDIQRNMGSAGFTNIHLGAVTGGAISWCDYDNDNRLDFLDGNNLYHNDLTSSNAAPTAPGGLGASAVGPLTILTWHPGSDDITPAIALTYNLRVGSTPGAENIFNPSSAANGKRRLARMGNVQNGTNAILSLGSGLHYWSVQAIDGAFVGSAFSTNSSFIRRPQCTIKGVTDYSVSTATLQGTVLAGTTTTNTFQFLYGTNGVLDKATPLQAIPPGRTFVPVTANISGLVQGTTYSYKLSVMTDVGNTNSPTLTFATVTDDPPSIVSVSVTNVTTGSALLKATILPNKQSTIVRFYYGTNGVCNNATPLETFSGTASVAVSALITNLSPGTTYSYFLYADNIMGVAQSTNLTFQTSLVLGNALLQTNGLFQLRFNGGPGAFYNILVSTNLSTWDVIGEAVEQSPGLFQFIDTGTTNQPRRFYLLRSFEKSVDF